MGLKSILNHLKTYLFGVFSTLFLVSCAGFSYHYYGLDGMDFSKGKLLGPEPSADLPFIECSPTTKHKSPCVILRVEDFFWFKQDYDDTKMRLEACERGT